MDIWTISGRPWRRCSMASMFDGVDDRWRRCSMASMFDGADGRWRRWSMASMASMFDGVDARWRRCSMASMFDGDPKSSLKKSRKKIQINWATCWWCPGHYFKPIRSLQTATFSFVLFFGVNPHAPIFAPQAPVGVHETVDPEGELVTHMGAMSV